MTTKRFNLRRRRPCQKKKGGRGKKEDSGE